MPGSLDSSSSCLTRESLLQAFKSALNSASSKPESAPPELGACSVLFTFPAACCYGTFLIVRKSLLPLIQNQPATNIHPLVPVFGAQSRSCLLLWEDLTVTDQCFSNFRPLRITWRAGQSTDRWLSPPSFHRSGAATACAFLTSLLESAAGARGRHSEKLS